MPGEGEQTLEVLAASVRKIPHAFARAIGRHADADVIHRPQPQPMNGESAPADLAREFAKRRNTSPGDCR